MTRDEINNAIIEAGMDAANDAAHAGHDDHDQLVAGICAALTRLAEIAEAEGVKALTAVSRDAEYDRAYAIGFRGGYAKHGQSIAAHTGEGPKMVARFDDLAGSDDRLAEAKKHLPSPCWLQNLAKGEAGA